jgi:hypothetical protein
VRREDDDGLAGAPARAGDALRDGVLVDVSATAREAGIRFPVALTRAVWERCVTIPPGVLFQDEAGRVWDVCWLLACAIRRGGSAAEVRFGVHVRNDNRERTPPLVRLKAACGPGDHGEPVVTVMLPGED